LKNETKNARVASRLARRAQSNYPTIQQSNHLVIHSSKNPPIRLGWGVDTVKKTKSNKVDNT
jgi:hypothetical protein